MKLSILIEWEAQRVGNGRLALGARAFWDKQEMVMSSTAFDPSLPEERLRAEAEVFDPILEKLRDKLKLEKI